MKDKSLVFYFLPNIFFLSPDELEEGSAVLRYSVIWPRCELELLDFSPVCVAHLVTKILDKGVNFVSLFQFINILLSLK